MIMPPCAFGASLYAPVSCGHHTFLKITMSNCFIAHNKNKYVTYQWALLLESKTCPRLNIYFKTRINERNNVVLLALYCDILCANK